MPTKILLIENDPAFANEVSESLEATGFEVRATGDGKEGLELAHDWAPAAIVLCVELPGMSGYLVCQKLKKDDALKSIPLVLTSAEATEETFEKHKTLKARADEYLLKPYAPGALLERLGALVGMPEGAGADAVVEEEVVSLEEELGLEASAGGSPDEEIPGLDLESLPDEPAAGSAPSGLDEDLKLLDDAFEGLATPHGSTAVDAVDAIDAADAALDELTGDLERPVPAADVDAAASSLPDEDEGTARAELATLDADAEAALGALGASDEAMAPVPSSPLRGASADLLRAAGIKVLDEPVAPERKTLSTPAPRLGLSSGADAREDSAELDHAREALDRARRDLEARGEELREVKRRADDAEAEVARVRAKAESAAAQLRKAEADAKAGRDEARRASDQARAAETKLADVEERLGELEQRLAESERRASAAEADARRRAEEAAAAQEAVARAETLEREADELRTELLVARGEAEGARGEVEKRTADLRKRVAEVEAASAKNEERVVKAYQKIKADEKVRDKVRKALAIATQLIEEGLPAETPAERERRLAGGRE